MFSCFFIFKQAITASFRSFSSFQPNIKIFTTNKCEKCPSSIWCWDSNPQPSEHESHPITTRPRLPPSCFSLRTFSIRIVKSSYEWHSGCGTVCFRYQNSRVRIQSSATIIDHLFITCKNTKK